MRREACARRTCGSISSTRAARIGPSAMVRCSTGPSDRNGSVWSIPRRAGFISLDLDSIAWAEDSCIDVANEVRLQKEGRDEPMSYCFTRWGAKVRWPHLMLTQHERLPSAKP